MLANQKTTASVSSRERRNGSAACVSGRSASGMTTTLACAPAASAALHSSSPTSANGSSTRAWKRSPGCTARQRIAFSAQIACGPTSAVLLGECHQPGRRLAHEPVSQQRGQDLAIVLRGRPRPAVQLAEQPCAALATGALQRALPAKRREALAAGGAAGRQ